MAKKQSKVKRASNGVTVQDFNWGAIFSGSKEALIRAKIAPRGFKMGAQYRLPLDYSERYNRMVGSGKGVPKHWDAQIGRDHKQDGYNVYVEFDKVRDLAVRDRMDGVMQILEMLRRHILTIPPQPLSQAVPESIERDE